MPHKAAAVAIAEKGENVGTAGLTLHAAAEVASLRPDGAPRPPLGDGGAVLFICRAVA